MNFYEAPRKHESLGGVEKQANYEGNHTNLFFERIKHPAIKERLVNDILEHHLELRGGDDNDPAFLVLLRKEIEEELAERIKKAESHTNIKYASEGEIGGRQDEGVGMIFLHSINPDTGESFTSKMNGIIEAHEKGHELRWFGFDETQHFIAKVRSGFDFSQVEIPDTLVEVARKMMPGQTDEELLNIIRVYQNNVNEIYERMSQLKNYFGMSGNEIFTKEHLVYAKQHYSADTGMGCQIQLFLDAVTPETEKRFLELMNTLGV